MNRRYGNSILLYLPDEPQALLEELRSVGVDLANRLIITVDYNTRRGFVQLDHWHMHATVFELPRIVQFYTTSDSINFESVGEISRMIICRLEERSPSTGETGAIAWASNVTAIAIDVHLSRYITYEEEAYPEHTYQEPSPFSHRAPFIIVSIFTIICAFYGYYQLFYYI